MTLDLFPRPGMFSGCQALLPDTSRVIVPLLMILGFDSRQKVGWVFVLCVCGFSCMSSQLQVQGGWIWTK